MQTTTTSFRQVVEPTLARVPVLVFLVAGAAMWVTTGAVHTFFAATLFGAGLVGLPAQWQAIVAAAKSTARPIDGVADCVRFVLWLQGIPVDAEISPRDRVDFGLLATALVILTVARLSAT